MRPTERLIFELGRQKNTLGRPIQPEEVPELVESLRNRLGVLDKELDLSPKSLKFLEKRLVEFKQTLDQEGRLLSEEELTIFIRQLAAYMGEMLVASRGGFWNPINRTLFNASIVIKGDWKRIEDGERFILPSVAVVVGVVAAGVWDDLVDGKVPHLYRWYRDATSKRQREKIY